MKNRYDHDPGCYLGKFFARSNTKYLDFHTLVTSHDAGLEELLQAAEDHCLDSPLCLFAEITQDRTAVGAIFEASAVDAPEALRTVERAKGLTPTVFGFAIGARVPLTPTVLREICVKTLAPIFDATEVSEPGAASLELRFGPSYGIWKAANRTKAKFFPRHRRQFAATDTLFSAFLRDVVFNKHARRGRYCYFLAPGSVAPTAKATLLDFFDKENVQ